jgi:hypothetical protein
MDCAEIRDALVSGACPAGQAVDEHVRECAACAELLRDQGNLGRALARPDAPPADDGALWASVERAIDAERGPLAWLRSRPTPVRLLAALLGGAIVVFLGGRARDGHAAPERSLVWLAAFAVAGAVSIWFLLAPLGRRRPSFPLRVALIGSALGLPFFHALTGSLSERPPPRSVASFAEQAFACFSYGLLLTLPFLAVLWALERSQRPWLKVVTGAGALAGLVANAALTLHCASTDAHHLALGHATIGVGLVCLGALGAIVRTKTV